MKTITHSLLGFLLFTIHFVIAQPSQSFILINTDTETEIGPLNDGDTINSAEYGSVNLGIVYSPVDPPGGVYFTLRGPFNHNQSEGSSPPYSLFGDIGIDVNGRLFPVGDYVLTANPNKAPAYQINFSVIEEDPICDTGMDTVPPVARCNDATITLDVNGFASLSVSDVNNGSTDNCRINSMSVENEFTEVGVFPVVLTVTDGEGNTDTCTAMVTVEPYDPNEPVAELILVDADTDAEIIKLAPNIKINKDLIGDGPIGIIFNPEVPPGGVTFRLRGPVNETRSEGASPPYSVFGDIGVDVQGKPFPVGSYTIEANPNVGEILFIAFEIVESYIPGAFVSTWQTDNPGPSPANQITIPTYPGETYNYTVNWGDGHITPGYTGDATHTYASPGTYMVSITGQFPGINFGQNLSFPFTPSTDNLKILLVNQWGNIQWQRMDNAFFYCFNLDVVAMDAPDLSSVSSLDRLFSSAYNLKGNEFFNTWDTRNITSMFATLASTDFNHPINNWDVSNVTNMAGMFENAEAFNQPIGNWDVSNVTNMAFMFESAFRFNQDIGNWDVSSVTNMAIMFVDAVDFNQDIGNWDVSSVSDMSNMFAYASSFNQSLSQWDISSVTTMEHMFGQSGLSTANYDATLIGWNILDAGESQIPQNILFDAGSSQYCDGAAARQNLIDTYGWMITDGGENCFGEAFITTWKTDNPGPSPDNEITIPTYPGETYDYTVDWGDGQIISGYTGDAAHTYTSPGTYTVSITGQFPGINFGKGLSSFPYTTDLEKILLVNQWGNIQWQRMDNAFYFCSKLDVIAMDAPDLSSVTSLDNLFHGAKELISNEALNTWDTSNITSMVSTLAYTQYNDPLDNWDVSNVTNMLQMFENAEEFNQPIGGWDVSNVTDMSFMFNDAIGFNRDISSWNVSSVTNMRGLFSFASDFNQDIGNWDVANVVDMAFMFAEATVFNQDLSTWDISSVTTMVGMFEGAGLSTPNYDDTLIGWSGLPSLQAGVTFDAGFSQYCEAAAERAQIINDYNWAINDSGQNCTGIPAITHFVLVNADSNGDILNPLFNNAAIDLSSLPTTNLNIRAETTSDVESVRLELTNGTTQAMTENFVPYALFGDIMGNYNPGTLTPGVYILTATPYSGNNLSGTMGTPLTINFIVSDSSGAKPSVILYPNPASTQVNLGLDSGQDIKGIQLHDGLGRLVRNHVGSDIKIGNQYLINVSQLPEGIYYIRALDELGNIIQEPVVIEHR